MEAELQLLLQVRLGWVMAARGTLGRWRDALSQNHCPHMSRRYWVASQCQAKWHGCPKPPVPMGAPGWGWGLRHSGCQGLGPEHMPWHLLPARPPLWAVWGLQSAVLTLPPPAPTPAVRPQPLGERLCLSKGGGPACPHAPHIDLPRENQ